MSKSQKKGAIIIYEKPKYPLKEELYKVVCGTVMQGGASFSFWRKMGKSLKLIILLITIFSISAIGQTKVKYINFSKDSIYFKLSGKIEIDGHTFINDTCKYPIVYAANLEGIKIFKKGTNQGYKVRKCYREKCDIIHLEVIKAHCLWDADGNIEYHPLPNIIYDASPNIINHKINLGW